MKKLFLACAVALCGFAATATAQDCYPACNYNPCNYNPCCDVGGFDGLYVGGNLGVLSHTAHRNNIDGFFPFISGVTLHSNATGFTAGVQVGYDMQCSSKLVGLVWDWNWASARRTHRIADFPPMDATIRNRLKWFSTIRLRAGLTVCDALFYVTGGAAFARTDARWDLNTGGTGPLIRNARFNGRWGWTAGAGTEFLMGCSWSLGAEFLFMHFGHRTNTLTTDDDSTFTFHHHDSAWTGRFILNYRIGGLCCN